MTFAPTVTDNTNHGRATIAAVYVQDQIQFSPNWLAVLGLRYDSFDMDFTDRRGAGVNIDTSDDLLSPRGGLIYKPVENVSLYASYSMTYVPRAGAQLSSLTLTNEAFDPEEFENIEVGAKWDVNPSLALTAALFQLDRKNVVIPDPANPTDPAASLLVDGQRTEGIELGISGRVNESWSIQGGYAYQDGHLTEDLGGTRLAQLPKHVATLWNRYDFTPAFGVGLGVIYQTDMFAAADNLVDAARIHARRRRRVLHAERAAAPAAQCREPVRRALLPECPQQQQHHAGIAAGRPRVGDRQLLRSLMRAAREQDYTPGSWGCGFAGDEGAVRAAVRVRGRAAFGLRLVAARRVFDRHAAAGAGERRASGCRGRAGPVSRDLLRRARRPRPRTA